MPGMQGTTSVKKFQSVQNGLPVTCLSNCRFCAEIQSDVDKDRNVASGPRDSAADSPNALINHVPVNVPLAHESPGELPLEAAKSRRERRQTVCLSQRKCWDRRAAAPESVADQIRKFMERPDLRNCCLPGMIGRISRDACEGWQRQARSRSSKLIVKIKLDPCKKCQFYIHTGMADVQHKQPGPAPLNYRRSEL